MTSGHNRLIKLSLLIISLIVSWLLVEAALYTIPNPLVAIYDFAPIYKPDNEIGYRYIPGSSGKTAVADYTTLLEVNQQGYLDSDFSPEKAPSSTRVAVIGDSFAAGVANGKKGFDFPTVLEQTLNNGTSTGHTFDVYNFGVDGIGTEQEAEILYEDVLSYQPDIVILEFYQNDIRDVASPMLKRESYRGFMLSYITDNERHNQIAWVDEFYLSPIKRVTFQAIRKSLAIRALYNVAQRQLDPEINLTSNALFRINPDFVNQSSLTSVRTDSESVDRIVDLVGEMDAACKDADCSFVFVQIPRGDRFAKGEVDQYEDMVLNRIQQTDIYFLSLEDAFVEAMDHGNEIYWRYDGHINSRGAEIVGQELARFLIEHDLIES